MSLASAGSLRRRVLRRIEEDVHVATFSSPRRRWWIAVHAGVTSPLLGWGRVRIRRAAAGEAVLTLRSYGPVKRMAPVLDPLFPPLGPPVRLGWAPLWSPHRLAGRPGDVVAAAVHRLAAARFRAAGWLTVPAVVRWRSEVTPFPPPASGRSLASDLRRLGRWDHEREPAGGEDAWREFVREMVLPLGRERFGEAAALPSPHQLRSLAARGCLLFVRRDGRRVAGICAVPRGSTLWLPLMGIRDGGAGAGRELASIALHAAAFAWARERGFRTIDLGRSSPFVHDGLQRFRRKWGFRAVADPITPLTALRVEPGCAPAVRALARLPVLVDSGRGLARHPSES